MTGAKSNQKPEDSMNGSWWKRIAVGILIGVSVMSVGDCVASRKALADAAALRDQVNVRQDTELQALRRDVDRLEHGLGVINGKLDDMMQLLVSLKRDDK